MSDRILWFLFAESDKLIGGKVLGKESLGFYSVANHLATLPIQKLAGLIKTVAFPAFSRVQTDLARVRFYLLKTVRMLSVLAFAVFFGASCAAPEIVATFLGTKWQDSLLPLQLLALVMPMRMISVLLPPPLWGVGMARVSATNYLIAAIIMPIAFVIGASWGIVGLAMAWLLVYPIVFVIKVNRTCRAIDMGIMDFFASMSRPALAGSAMYAAVAGARSFVGGGFGAVGSLLQLAAVGAFVYTMLLFVICRDGLREAYGLLRR